MSAAEVRQALADAASTVEGINCSPYYVQAWNPGAATVRKDRVDYPNAFGGVVTWQVIVAVPQDTAAAEQFIDEKAPLLVAALSPQMQVTDVVPQQQPLPEGGTIPIVLIQGNREEE